MNIITNWLPLTTAGIDLTPYWGVACTDMSRFDVVYTIARYAHSICEIIFYYVL